MKKVVELLMPILLSMLTPEVIKKAIDSLLDIAEDAAQDSSNTIDDKTVLPFCALIRAALNIPDDD